MLLYTLSFRLSERHLKLHRTNKCQLIQFLLYSILEISRDKNEKKYIRHFQWLPIFFGHATLEEFHVAPRQIGTYPLRSYRPGFEPQLIWDLADCPVTLPEHKRMEGIQSFYRSVSLTPSLHLPWEIIMRQFFITPWVLMRYEASRPPHSE